MCVIPWLALLFDTPPPPPNPNPHWIPSASRTRDLPILARPEGLWERTPTLPMPHLLITLACTCRRQSVLCAWQHVAVRLPPWSDDALLDGLLLLRGPARLSWIAAGSHHGRWDSWETLLGTPKSLHTPVQGFAILKNETRKSVDMGHVVAHHCTVLLLKALYCSQHCISNGYYS